MAERILLTEALDERDLLEKKIRNKIEMASFVDCAKKNEERVFGNYKEKEEYRKDASAAFQQITDLIARYDRLTVAINHSNANTMIQTSGGSYIIADAIAVRARMKEREKDKSRDFEFLLYKKMEEEFASVVVEMDKRNQQVRATAENMRLSILGKDSKTKEDKPLEVVDVFVKENTTELVDPLDVIQKLIELKEKHDTFLKELETGIKVANATTYVEF